MLHEHQRIGERVLGEAESLSALHQVRIVCWNQGRETPELGRDIDVRWLDSQAAASGRHWGWRIPSMFRRMADEAREFRPDVIHVTHLSLLPLGILLKYRMGAQLVYDVYERHSVTMTAEFPISSVARRFIEAIENWMVRISDCVLTVDSPDGMLEERYRKRRSDNLEVLYNVPPLEVGEKAASSRSRGGEVVLVYVGGLNEAKGIVRAAETLAILHDWDYPARLLLIGDFQDGREDFMRVLSEHDLSGAVDIVSWVPYAEMMRRLRGSSIALALHQDHPKFRYVSKGTGRKFFTYMQAGLPIIAPMFWEIGQVVWEERCGILVDTRDPLAIAGAVKRLIDEPAFAKELGQRGKRAVENRYNWDREQEKLLRAYEKLACKRARDRREPGCSVDPARPSPIPDSHRPWWRLRS